MLGTIESLHDEAERRKLYFQKAEPGQLDGRTVRLQGEDLVSFSSCSYLGLEHHPHIVEGVIDAVRRYGSQFSSSRGYLCNPLYEEVEAKLSRIFGGHALVTSSTTLGHQVAIPVLVTERDAIVMDHQVHYSVQMAANLARQNGATVEIVRHSQLERATEVVARLARTHRTVWFATDGVFSMYGDLAPLHLLKEILDVAPNVRLYVDDAHGMSWRGQHGRGSFLSRMPMHDRMILATSLNKAFSAGGGCLVFPTVEERRKVLHTGGPMVFSGPVQPPMLGAASASADIHLSDEIVGLQHALADRTALTNELMDELGLPLLVRNSAPIFFVRMGLPRVSFAVAERMRADGWFVNVSAYPSVPLKRSGIRFTVTAGHRLSDVEGALRCLAAHVPRVLDEERVTRHELDELFARAVPEEARGGQAAGFAGKQEELYAGGVSVGAVSAEAGPAEVVGLSAPTLRVEHVRSILALDRVEWNDMLGKVGSCSWEALALCEDVFRKTGKREHDWDFHYVVVRDASGKPVAATFFTGFVSKDDMLMRAEVSEAVEERRVDDPYFLTSDVLCMGSGFSEGDHLYLDRDGPWKEALVQIVQLMSEEYEQRDAGMMMLRDLPAADVELESVLLDRGFVRIPMFNSHYVDIAWSDEDGWLASLSSKKRRAMRKILAQAETFERRVYGVHEGNQRSLDTAALDQLYGLYRNVADRKRRLNVFPLPRHLMEAILRSPVWEIVTFTLPESAGGPAHGGPVAFYAAHRFEGEYAPFFCGLDYDYVLQHGAYRTMLSAMVQRSIAQGWTRVHLGMDADTEKRRLGSRMVENSVFVQARDHFNGRVLHEIVAEVGVEGRRRSA